MESATVDRLSADFRPTSAVAAGCFAVAVAVLDVAYEARVVVFVEAAGSAEVLAVVGGEFAAASGSLLVVVDFVGVVEALVVGVEFALAFEVPVAEVRIVDWLPFPRLCSVNYPSDLSFPREFSPPCSVSAIEIERTTFSFLFYDHHRRHHLYRKVY